MDRGRAHNMHVYIIYYIILYYTAIRAVHIFNHIIYLRNFIDFKVFKRGPHCSLYYIIINAIGVHIIYIRVIMYS